MKVIIDNRTRWNTTDLRALYKAALRAAGAKHDVQTSLVVKQSRCSTDSWGMGIRGRCFVGSHSRPGTCQMRIPATIATDSFRDQVARVLHHEALHAVGARHKDMTEEQLYCRQDVPWAAPLPLHPDLREEPAREPQAARTAAFTDKLDHARVMLRKAATREKRASTIHAKWRRRVRMLERKTP